MDNRPIVVGVNGSSAAARALRWAAREAVRRAVPLLIVHTCELIQAAVPHATAVRGYRDAVIEDGRTLLAEAAEAARDAAAQVVVDTALTSGSAAEQLIARSAAADTVVVGTRGLGGISSVVAGSVAVALAAHGHCPVIVVRGPGTDGQPPQHGPVIIGLDGSPTSKAAIPFAFRAAAARGVAVVAVNAWTGSAIGSVSQAALTEAWQSEHAEQVALLSSQIAECHTRFPDVEVEQTVTRDRPAHALLNYGEHAQLIVVGSRGRGGFRGLLLGSTSQALIHHAPCPVAVVPPPWR